jgi:hypothetical protein
MWGEDNLCIQPTSKGRESVAETDHNAIGKMPGRLSATKKGDDKPKALSEM